MSRWLLLILTLVLLAPVAQAQQEASVETPEGPARGSEADWETEDWDLVTDRDDIKVYMAHDNDARIKTFRGVTTLPMEDFTSIGAAFDDYDFVASWLHMVSEIEGLERNSDFDREVYVTTRLPWPVSDRDTPLWVGLEQRDNYAVYIPFHHMPDRMPEKGGFVRIPQMQGFFLFKPLEPGEVKMTFQVVLDPGGYVPAWLANMILRDIPYFSMKRLRRVVNLDEYQNADHGYYEIPPAWRDDKDNADESPEEKTEAASSAQ